MRAKVEKIRKSVAKKAAPKPRKRAAKKAAPKKSKAKKPAFKKPPSTRGYTTAGQPEARHRMESLFKQAQLELRMDDIDSKRFIHVNRDGSIDAELSVKVPRGKSMREMYDAISKSLPRRSPGLWISAGARFTPSRDEDNYHRFRGLAQVQAYYRKYGITKDEGAGKALVLLAMTATKDDSGVALKVQKRHGRKVDTVFVRLHWNSEGRQPGRDDARRDRRK
jgi:hypothetical protein